MLGDLQGALPVMRKADVVPEQLEQHAQALPGVMVVVHNEHAPPRLFRRLGGRLDRSAPRRPLRRYRKRQANHELAALAGAAARRLYHPAVCLAYALRSREADAEPAASPLLRWRTLGEEREDARQQIRRDPHAVVAYADRDRAGRRAGKRR